jgi:hypothetical protein
MSVVIERCSVRCPQAALGDRVGPAGTIDAVAHSADHLGVGVDEMGHDGVVCQPSRRKLRNPRLGSNRCGTGIWRDAECRRPLCHRIGMQQLTGFRTGCLLE